MAVQCSCVCCDTVRCALASGSADTCDECRNATFCDSLHSCTSQRAVTCDGDPFGSVYDWVPGLFLAISLCVAAGAVVWGCCARRKVIRARRASSPRRPSNEASTRERLLPPVDADGAAAGPSATGEAMVRPIVVRVATDSSLAAAGSPPAAAGRPPAAAAAAEPPQTPEQMSVSRDPSAGELSDTVERLSRMTGATSEDFDRAATMMIDYFPLEMPAARRLLLFCGVLRPTSCCSAWWLCWCGWRLLAVALLAYYVTRLAMTDGVRVLLAFDEGWVFLLLFYVPLMVAMVAHMGCAWLYLPCLLTSLPPQSAAALHRALRLALLFMGACLGVTAVLAAVLSAVEREGALWMATLVEGNAATPALGATLFVLGVELGTARERALQLVQRAREQQLERPQYEQLRDMLARRSALWQRVLLPTALICAFNTIASLYFVHVINAALSGSASGDATLVAVWHLLLYSLPVLPAFLVEEIALLLLLLLLTASINDAADAISAALVEAPWGPYGSAAEGARIDLLALSSISAITPESARSCCWHLTDRTAPAAFWLAGVRVTRGFVISAVVGFALSVLGAFVIAWLNLN